MLSHQLAAELSRLYSLEVEASEAYARAISLVASGPVNAELRLFSLEHQRHTLVLLDAMVRLGYAAPDVVPDVKGVVIGALTLPARPLTLEDILEGMRGNEQLTNSVYTKALARPLPRGVLELLRPLAADERTHLEWLERMVSRRVWESGTAGHP